jgi:hypothetical protein
MDAIAPRRCPGSGVRVGSAGGPAGHTAYTAPTTSTATTVGALNRPHHRPTRRLVARPEPPRTPLGCVAAFAAMLGHSTATTRSGICVACSPR